MIAIEDEIDDEDFTTDRDDKLLVDSNEDLSDHEATLVETVVIKNSRKRKNEDKEEPSKRKKVVERTSKNNLECNLCNTKFSRKDNLARHMRNKH